MIINSLIGNKKIVGQEKIQAANKRYFRVR